MEIKDRWFVIALAVTAIVTLVSFLFGVWFEDDRWGATGLIFLCVFGLTGFVAFFMGLGETEDDGRERTYAD